jgi:Poly(R)-hydroxyalkanoic acid synthase subunit (PHA_synth_III_E)
MQDFFNAICEAQRQWSSKVFETFPLFYQNDEYNAEWQERLSSWVSSIQKQLKSTEFIEGLFIEDEDLKQQAWTHCAEVFAMALEDFANKLTALKLSNDGQAMDQDFFKMWLDCCEKVYEKKLSMSEYQQFFAKVISQWRQDLLAA